MAGIWAKFAEVLHTAIPLLALIPGINPDVLPIIEDAVTVAEETGKPGATKKKIALAEIADAVAVYNDQRGDHGAIDVAAVGGAVSAGIDAVITTINAVKAATEGQSTVATVTTLAPANLAPASTAPGPAGWPTVADKAAAADKPDPKA